MRIPDNVAQAFKDAQRQMYGTETITWHAAVATSTGRGDQRSAPAATGTEYKDCNVSSTFDRADITAWGLRSGVDIRVARDDLPAGVGDFVKWRDRFYRVKQRGDGSLYGAVYCELWSK